MNHEPQDRHIYESSTYHILFYPGNHCLDAGRPAESEGRLSVMNELKMNHEESYNSFSSN